MKPTYEDVVAAIEEQNLDVDAEKFYDYYERNDWRMPNGAFVLDFRARLRAWANRKQMSKSQPETSHSTGNSYYDRWHADLQTQLARRAEYAKHRKAVQ
jgi:hypothetical protein